MWVGVLDSVRAFCDLPDFENVEDVLLLAGLDKPPERNPALGVRSILIVLKLADEVVYDSLAATGPLNNELEVCSLVLWWEVTGVDWKEFQCNVDEDGDDLSELVVRHHGVS